MKGILKLIGSIFVLSSTVTIAQEYVIPPMSEQIENARRMLYPHLYRNLSGSESLFDLDDNKTCIEPKREIREKCQAPIEFETIDVEVVNHDLNFKDYNFYLSFESCDKEKINLPEAGKSLNLKYKKSCKKLENEGVRLYFESSKEDSSTSQLFNSMPEAGTKMVIHVFADNEKRFCLQAVNVPCSLSAVYGDSSLLYHVILSIETMIGCSVDSFSSIVAKSCCDMRHKKRFSFFEVGKELRNIHFIVQAQDDYSVKEIVKTIKESVVENIYQSYPQLNDRNFENKFWTNDYFVKTIDDKEWEGYFSQLIRSQKKDYVSIVKL